MIDFLSTLGGVLVLLMIGSPLLFLAAVAVEILNGDD